jgi:hypothetical protein
MLVKASITDAIVANTLFMLGACFVPVRRLISLVPNLSALNDTISARQTCFCGALRPHERLQLEPIRRVNNDGNTGAHAPDSHAIGSEGIPSGIQMSGLIHLGVYS